MSQPFVERYKAQFPTISNLERTVVNPSPTIEYPFGHYSIKLPFHVYELDTPFGHRINVVQSAETRQLVIGGMGLDADTGLLTFIPSRRHDGFARAHNSEKFLEQAFSSRAFRTWLEETHYNPSQHLVLAPIMREGPVMSPHVAWFNVFGNKGRPPLNTVRTTHVGGGEGRTNSPVIWYTEQFAHPELGRSRDMVRAVLFFDSAAGGTTMDAVIREACNLFTNLEQVVLFSPYGSYQASVALHAACSAYGIRFSHYTAHEALQGDPEAWYDVSPPTDPQGKPLLLDTRDSELLIAIYGPEVAFKMCTGGDFSSTLCEPDVGAYVWGLQLAEHGLRPEDIPVTPITPSTLAGLHYLAHEVIPHSTYVEASPKFSPDEIRRLFADMVTSGR